MIFYEYSYLFSYGNIETLELTPKHFGTDVHKEMKKFIENFYVSEAMCACFISDCSMDELEYKVRQIFSNISKSIDLNGKIYKSLMFDQYGMPFDCDTSLGHIFKIISVKDIFQV